MNYQRENGIAKTAVDCMNLNLKGAVFGKNLSDMILYVHVPLLYIHVCHIYMLYVCFYFKNTPGCLFCTEGLK